MDGINCAVLAAMRIQVSDTCYDLLVKCQPEFFITERGLRNVFVSTCLRHIKQSYSMVECTYTIPNNDCQSFSTFRMSSCRVHRLHALRTLRNREVMNTTLQTGTRARGFGRAKPPDVEN